jgi:hypothetical protein
MIDENHIINHMLSTIGEGGVSTLNTLHPSVASAKRILETEDIEFQSTGWWFNVERDIKLVVNESGKVEVPANALAVIVSYLDDKSPAEKLRYAKRGKYIYDSYKHTTVINCSLWVTLTVRLPIEDLPPIAANYLKHKAAEAAYIADDGDNFKTTKLELRTAQAWQKLQDQKLKTLEVNALDNTVASQLRNFTGVRIGIPGGSQR